ncbi:N-acetylgalactosaminyltransferase 7-like [Ctenocephalides felis]|uniref:N-acetylgalactosaminyltransferase 7-like n=1 Tax=Ctenocephalides felis TaxID=7515 RepID=UPI000E6E171C|nr:N-acetylgalactosaminyltransferase 7-like [Ctenocephalides felis]
MRFASWRRRFFSIALFSIIVIPLFYILLTWTIQKERKFIRLSAFKNTSNIKDLPQLVEGLGNFELKNVLIREGPGEGGRPHRLRKDQQKDVAESESQYGMNMVCSDEISLDRTIEDTRLEECKHWNYPTKLPKSSVIIVFHNEGWSVLLRTVYSVINRSPDYLLHEILLVDDFSDKEHLGIKLEYYIKQWKGLVRLIRNDQREGLIRSRSRGAEEATGEVIIFLDAHCEVNTNWLPPLLAPIHRDSTIMTVPIIDRIDHKTFEYQPVYDDRHHFRGIFEWGMLYKENEVPYREIYIREHNSDPYKSPTHAGGLFAINREYFLQIGAYDPGLLVWGGENFELSFKIWQCGGSIEWVPCSKVGHVYRSFMPYGFGDLAHTKKGSLIKNNYKRVIETWFDEKHKEFFYTREPMAKFLDMGDISAQVQLKNKLQCKDFQWYMDNVAYDVLDKFPELPQNVHWGELRSRANGNCLDTFGRSPPSLMATQHCHGLGNNQLIRLNAAGQLGVGERCIEADTWGVKLAFCRLGTVDGPWKYDESSSTLIHQKRKKCMAMHPQTMQLSLMSCDVNNLYHQWIFQRIYPKWE